MTDRYNKINQSVDDNDDEDSVARMDRQKSSKVEFLDKHAKDNSQRVNSQKSFRTNVKKTLQKHGLKDEQY